MNKNTKDRIKNFKTKVNNGPYYTCVVCNRCLYRRSVVLFVQEKYEMPQENYFFVAHIESFDKREYICITRDKKLKKGDIIVKLEAKVCI